MTRSNKTEVVFLIDRSGSMLTIKNDMEGGFNSLIEEQRKLPGECVVSLIQFDDHYDVDYSSLPLAQVPPLVLRPRGSTALLGAMGRAIDEVGERLASTSEEDRPERVLFVVITDGQENCSHYTEWAKKYTKQEVFDRVGHQSEKYGWQFVYLGANQDAISVAREMGVNTAFNFVASSEGTVDMLNDVTIGVSNYRSSGNYQ